MADDILKGSIECISCAVVGPLETMARQYGAAVFERGRIPAITLLGTFGGIWAVGIPLVVLTGDAGPKQVMLGLVRLVVAATVLGTAGYWFYWVWDVAFSALGGLAQTALSDEAAKLGSGTGLKDLARGIEMVMRRVLAVAGALYTQTGLTTLHLMLAAFLLMATFFFLLVFYLGQITTALFRILAITVVAPWLILAGAFKSTSGMLVGGLKTVMASIFVVAVGTAGIGFTAFVMELVLVNTPVGPGGFDVMRMPGFAWSSDFYLVLLVGLLGIAWQWEAATIASGIAGVFLNSVGPALFAAGATWIFTAPMRASGRMLGSGAKKAGSVLGDKAMEWGGERLSTAGSRMAEYLRARGLTS
jgi:hypothetical protein